MSYFDLFSNIKNDLKEINNATIEIFWASVSFLLDYIRYSFLKIIPVK